jgi:hypothetical protein
VTSKLFSAHKRVSSFNHPSACAPILAIAPGQVTFGPSLHPQYQPQALSPSQEQDLQVLSLG